MNALLIIVLVLFINKSSSDEYFRIDLGKDVTFSCLFPHEYQLNQVSRMKSFSLSLALLMIKTAKNCGLLKKKVNENNCYFEEHSRAYFDGMMP